jgi:hypothetical protein
MFLSTGETATSPNGLQETMKKKKKMRKKMEIQIQTGKPQHDSPEFLRNCQLLHKPKSR